MAWKYTPNATQLSITSPWRLVKTPKETLTVLFHSGLTDVKELLSKTGMNEKTLYRNLAKLKKGKTLKRKKGSGRPKKTRSSNLNLSRKLLEHTQNTVPRISGTSYRRGEMLMCAHALSSAVFLIVGAQKRSQTKFPIWPLFRSRNESAFVVV